MNHLFVAFFLFAGSSVISGSDFPKGRLLTSKEGCGYTKVTTNRIVGGSDAKPGAWPWIAQIGYRSKLSDKKTVYLCGGSLITSRHVLTAAHCIEPHLISVRLGEYDTSTTTDGPTEDRDVVKIESHPRYNKPFMANDIAILYLKSDIEFTDRIKPVCLPLEKQQNEENLVGRNPFVAGWGRTDPKSALSNPKILQQVQVPIHDNSVCVTAFKKVKMFISMVQYDNSAICAGDLGGGHDSCKGDSGGPMMMPVHENGKFPFYQIGIVSYGKDCGLKMPSMYSRVSHHADWIKEQLAKQV